MQFCCPLSFFGARRCIHIYLTQSSLLSFWNEDNNRQYNLLLPLEVYMNAYGYRYKKLHIRLQIERILTERKKSKVLPFILLSLIFLSSWPFYCFFFCFLFWVHLKKGRMLDNYECINYYFYEKKIKWMFGRRRLLDGLNNNRRHSKEMIVRIFVFDR